MSGLEVYFRECVETRLDGIEATARYLEPTNFQSGFMAALQAVRASFGLAATMLIISQREGVMSDEQEIDGGPGQFRISERAFDHR